MTTMPADYALPGGGYPIELQVDPPQPQGRLSVFLRFIFAIPHLIIIGALGYAVGVTAFIAWLVILFTGKCPEGLAKFHAGYIRWSARSTAYVYLLSGRYPPFSLDDDSNYPVRANITPQIEGRNRLTVLLRVFMIIPHVIVLAVLMAVGAVLLLVGWLAGIFTGSVPAGIHTYLGGTLRWSTRVMAYYYVLTDESPPFGLR